MSALHGGRASTAAIATTLGRTQQDLSWLREELIEEGDVYVPKRGQLAMAVPLFNRYVLSHYERARPDAAAALLSLQDMVANAGLDASAVRPMPAQTTCSAASTTKRVCYPRPVAHQVAEAEPRHRPMSGPTPPAWTSGELVALSFAVSTRRTSLRVADSTAVASNKGRIARLRHGLAGP